MPPTALWPPGRPRWGRRGCGCGSPRMCAPCSSRLPAPPAHFNQRRSSCKAGADHQARWAGAWGGEGSELEVLEWGEEAVTCGGCGRGDASLRAHLDQVPLNYPSETVVQRSSTAHFHYGFPTVEPLSWYSNKPLFFSPARDATTPKKNVFESLLTALVQNTGDLFLLDHISGRWWCRCQWRLLYW